MYVSGFVIYQQDLLTFMLVNITTQHLSGDVPFFYTQSLLLSE